MQVALSGRPLSIGSHRYQRFGPLEVLSLDQRLTEKWKVNLLPMKESRPQFHLGSGLDVAALGQEPFSSYVRDAIKEHSLMGGEAPSRWRRQGVISRAKDMIRAVIAGRNLGLTRLALRSGLRLVQTSNISWKDEVAYFKNDDPQLIFRAPSGLISALAMFEVELDVAEVDSPQLFVDYGDGFSKDFALPLRVDEDRLTALVLFPSLLRRLRLDPSSRSGRCRFTAVRLRAVAPDEGADPALGPACARDLAPFLSDGSDFIARVKRIAVAISRAHAAGGRNGYSVWNGRHVDPTESELTAMRRRIPGNGPLFSVILPVYDVLPEVLSQTLDSILAQTYPRLEICVVDDASPTQAVRDLIESYAAMDARVRFLFRAENGHISKSSNDALAMAQGEWCVLVDHDDLLAPQALWTVADAIARRPDASIFYSDEDKIDMSGRRSEPYHKGAFNRFLMYAHNMVSHLGVYRTDLMRAVGGFRSGYEGSQDYDLTLRCMERCGENAIVHLPMVLYHWRMIAGSTALSADQKGYAIHAAVRAINDHFSRTDAPLRSVVSPVPGITRVEPRPETTPATSITVIIPTRDKADLLATCVGSIQSAQDAAVDVIVVDNGSVEPATLRLLDSLRKKEVEIVRVDEPFNYSKLNNLAAAQARGDILLLLNNDVRLTSPDWALRARALLSLQDVGAVGGRLLGPDGRLQHNGLVVGMGAHGVAGTPHRGLAADSPGYFGKAVALQQMTASTAALLFVRRKDYLEVDGLDESFPIAYNDVDLCLKLRARGLKVVVDSEIIGTHLESASRGLDRVDPARGRRLQEEAARMRDRWGKSLAEDPYWSPNHSLERDDYTLANPPRTVSPWRDLPPAPATHGVT